MYVYKFRHTKYLINSKYNELKNEVLYFSHYGYLNDPLEGNVELVWHGDEIVWKNFLNHYLLCLFHKYLQISHPQSNEEFNDKIPIDITEMKMFDECRIIYKQIKKLFFDDPVVSSIIRYLSSKESIILKNELLNHTHMMNNIAMNIIVKTLYDNGLCDNQEVLELFKIHEDVYTEYSQILDSFDHNPEPFLQFFKRQELLYKQTAIRCQVPLRKDECKKRKMYLVNFPCIYTNQLYRLVFPDWYVSCFTSSYDNSAMWGNYGDGHKGVCLRFKTNEKNEIKICSPDSTQPNMTTAYTPTKFLRVNYLNKILKIDFFRTLYSISPEILEKYWYKDENGNESACMNVLNNGENRSYECDYIFKNVCTRKTIEWYSEQEYRLIARGINNVVSNNGVSFKYEFKDLDAVIFGMKTPYSEMAEIIRIIANKCKKYKRNDFKFYMSVYDSKSKKIEIEELKIVEEYLHEFAD